MSAGFWTVIAGIISLAGGILSEFFSAQARKRKDQAAFDEKELSFNILAQKALEKLYLKTVQAGKQSQIVQDKLDEHMKKKSTNDEK